MLCCITILLRLKRNGNIWRACARVEATKKAKKFSKFSREEIFEIGLKPFEKSFRKSFRKNQEQCESALRPALPWGLPTQFAGGPRWGRSRRGRALQGSVGGSKQPSRRALPPWCSTTSQRRLPLALGLPPP